MHFVCIFFGETRARLHSPLLSDCILSDTIANSARISEYGYEYLHRPPFKSSLKR